MPPSPASRLSRRSTLAGLTVAAAATAGCTARGAESVSESGSGASSSTPSPSGTSGGVEPDVALAARVLAREQEMLDRLRDASRRHPALRRRLAGPRAVHRAHVALLTRAVPAAVRPDVARDATRHPYDPDDRVLAALLRAERALARDCAAASLAARSGAFARVLASLSAAAAQQSSVLLEPLLER